MEILLHFLSFSHWKVFKRSKIAQIYYYDPQFTGINLQSPRKWFNSLDTYSSLILHHFCLFRMESGSCGWAFPASGKKCKTLFVLFVALLGFFISSAIFCVGFVAAPWKCSFGEGPFSLDMQISCTTICALVTTTPATVVSLFYMVINVLLCYGLIKKKLDVIYIWQIFNVFSIFALFPVAHFYVSCFLISKIF